jgi:outer membrane receptor protein involved in Fe transport
MIPRVSRVLLGTVSALALFSPLCAVRAQTTTADTPAETGGLSEIVVTATRRQERLQDVPISVAAFSQEKMDEQGLRNIDDLSRLSPGLSFQRNGMSSAGNYNDEGSDINIRGIDSTAGTSTTGIYIDDTPIQTRHVGFGSINAFPALFDLDRVEVLRGPQGTTFGAGAEGGVVRFLAPEANLHTPSGYFRADAAATQYGSPSYEGGAAFGAPIIEDVLAFRASASYRRDGGWVDRVNYTLSDPAAPTPTPSYSATTQPNANYWETTTARLALKWKVNDALTISPSIYYQRLQIHDTAAYWMSLSDPSNGVFRSGNALTNPSNDAFTLSAVKLQWDMGFAQLFSNTAFYDRNQNAQSDYTQYLRATWASFGELPNTFPAAGDQGYATFQDNQRNFYQEVRLASSDANSNITWNAGVFFSHLKESVPESIYDKTLDQEVINYTGGAASICVPGVPALECPGGLIYYGPGDTVTDKQIAIFGDFTYKFLDVFKATVGLRLSKIDFSGSVNETGPFLGTTIVTSNSGSDKPVTPKVLFSWQPDRDNLYYISATKGFRPGGVNVAVGDICAGDLTKLGISQVPSQYNADNLWSYELGGKITLLDHRMQINASLFYVDWRNIQQNVYLPSCGEQFTANLGKAKSEGGDIEILYRPIDPLTLDLSAAYTDARLTKTSCAGTSVFEGGACVGEQGTTAPISTSGDALLGAPWSFTSSAQYDFPKWQDATPYLRFDYQHQTAQHSLLPLQDSRNALYDTTIPGLPVVNNLSARAGARYNGLDVSLYANNLTNSQPLMFESRDIASNATDLLYFGRGVRPRTYGVTAIYRY